jgi:hypothetical protein
LTELKLKARHL